MADEEEIRPPRTTLADRTQEYPGFDTVNPKTGLQRDYRVLAQEEIDKGLQRPLRLSYVHQKCGVVTRMTETIALTYARNPYFYTGTYCCGCRNHFPVGEDGEFVWDGTNIKVGT